MWRNLCLTKACKERKHEQEMASIDLQRQKIDIMTDIANKPASKPNPAIYLIPLGVLVFGAVTAFILIRKKKK